MRGRYQLQAGTNRLGDAATAGTLCLLEQLRWHLDGDLARCLHNALAYHTQHQHRVWPGESAFVGTLPHTSPATFRASASNALAAFFVLGRGREVWPCATQEFGRRQRSEERRVGKEGRSRWAGSPS